MSTTPTHGSDVQETPDWWKASDERFYPPELHPNYEKPVDSAPASSEPSLADQLRAAADRVGDEASTAAEAGVGSMGRAQDLVGAAADADEDDAATDPVKPGMPLTLDSIDPRATIAQLPQISAADMGQTFVQQPTTPQSPGSPPSMLAAMAPAPGAIPPAQIEEGFGGIAYTSQGAPLSVGGSGVGMAEGTPALGAPMPLGMVVQPPAATARTKASSRTSGLIALVAGATAIAGSLLQWGKGAVTGIGGVEKAIIEVPGFDSSGVITAAAGGVLVLVGILFLAGVPKQFNWAILAFLGGAVIVGAVVFSMIDISNLSNRYAAQWQADGLASAGDVISTTGDIGLWVTGASGVLGVLAATFVKRS